MRVEPYTGLAALYDSIGLSAYTESVLPRLLEMAFVSGWVGRTVLDIGCGTGAAACFLAEQNYRVIACDISTTMLTIGLNRAKEKGFTIEWLHGPAQTLEIATTVDLALMLGGTFNLLPGLTDVEQTFQRVATILEPGKLFIFDVDTVRGLIEPAQVTEIIYNVPDEAFVVETSEIAYEQLTRTTEYQIFNRSLTSNEWLSYTETHVQRALPFVAVKRLLSRAGLTIIGVLSRDLAPVDPETTSRIIIVAQKQSGQPAAAFIPPAPVKEQEPEPKDAPSEDSASSAAAPIAHPQSLPPID